tara:strand:+ start:311 stop:2488 length:2178 start_codon:yes stop_codon:yes gene_type:complete
MSDINVTAHGINPETGEYLSPAERKALFKKGRMGSKIDPSSFKSGVVSGVKAAERARKKAESEVQDFVDLEREMDKLNEDAAGGGGSGGATGAIVPFSSVDAGPLSTEVQDLEPPVEKVRVNVDDAQPQEAEESKETFKDALKKLLETLKRITKLKSKQGKASKKTDKLREKGKDKTKKKERKTPGRDVFGLGRKIKGKVTKTFGDIFGLFGDIIAFAALNWISDPKNREAVKGIMKFLGHAFKFINSFVEGFIDNTLTGLAQLLGPDRSIGERFSGALKLIGSFFVLRWLKNPFKIVKDLKKVFKIFSKFGKFVNKILRKPIRMIQNFVQKALNKTLGKLFKSAIFKPFRRFIIQVGGKSLFKLLGAVGRGFVKIISRVPFIGALLQFFMDVFLFKQPPARSAFKAIGGALLGAVGMLGGPIGAIIGGWVGSEAGGWLYDAWFGSGHNPDDPKKDEQEASGGDGTANPQTSGGGYTGQVPSAGTNAKALLNTIRFAEGTSHAEGYNTWFGGRTDMDLTSMTINEVVEEQKRRLRNGEATYGSYTSAAVGAYQMMEPEVFAVKAGFDPATTKFTPEVQDKMAIAGYMMGQARMSRAEIDAPINREQIAKMAPVWASLPMMNGRSRYNQPVKSFETLQAVYNKSLGQGGGSGVFKPAAKMKRNPVKNMYMPSMSAEFTINEKIKHSVVSEQPIVINNIKEENVGVQTTGLILNKDKKSVNQILSRL